MSSIRASASGLPFRSSHLHKISPVSLVTDQKEPIGSSMEPTVCPTNPLESLKPATASLRRICMLWTHDESFSSEEVLVNFSQFPTGSIIAGALL